MFLVGGLLRGGNWGIASRCKVGLVGFVRSLGEQSGHGPFIGLLIRFIVAAAAAAASFIFSTWLLFLRKPALRFLCISFSRVTVVRYFSLQVARGPAAVVLLSLLGSTLSSLDPPQDLRAVGPTHTHTAGRAKINDICR